MRAEVPTSAETEVQVQQTSLRPSSTSTSLASRPAFYRLPFTTFSPSPFGFCLGSWYGAQIGVIVFKSHR